MNRAVRFAEPEEKRLARFLAAEGALISVDENNFTIPSPLMHTYLTDKVVSMDKRKSPHDDEPVPFGPGDSLDMPDLIRGALQAFNVEAMPLPAAILQARCWSWVNGRTSTFRGRLPC